MLCFALAFAALSLPLLLTERGAPTPFAARTARALRTVLILLLAATALLYLFEVVHFVRHRMDFGLRTFHAALSALCWMDMILYRRHRGWKKALLLTFLLAASMAELICGLGDIRPMFPFYLWWKPPV